MSRPKPSTPEAEPRKAVILGASGFIGINLARKLAAEGGDVLCFSRTRSPHWPRECRVLLGDLSDPPVGLVPELPGAAVYHLVSSTRPSASTVGAGDELIANNVATLRLLEAARSVDCRWVFASSGGTVYGQPLSHPVSEEHPTDPISSYGIGKLAMEKYFALYRGVHGIDYVVARIANPYGPWQDRATGQGLVAALFDRLSADETVEIWGDGENVRDFLYIEDAVDGLISTSRAGAAGRIYNIGSGIGTSVNRLAAMISHLVGAPARMVHTPARSVDVRRSVLDITRIGEEVGWRPRHGLDVGLALTWRWLNRGDKGVRSALPLSIAIKNG